MPASSWRYQRPRNAWGTTALVCAVVALAVGLVPIAGDLTALPLSAAAIGCGIRALLLAEDGLASNRTTALAGFVLGLVAALMSSLSLLVLITD